MVSAAVAANRRRRDAAGAVLTLWVVILAPAAGLLAAGAAVLPSYVSAEAAVQDTADGLAFIAATQRETQPAGDLPTLPPCGDLTDVTCNAMWDRFVADLGSRGVDARTVSGYYTDTSQEVLGAGGLAPCPPGQALALSSGAVAVSVTADFAADTWAAAVIWREPVTLGARSVGGQHTLSAADRAASCVAVYDPYDTGAWGFWSASPRHLLGR